MSEAEQIKHLGDELDKIVDRFRKEYDMTYAGIVGTFHMKAHLLCVEAAERGQEEEGK